MAAWAWSCWEDLPATIAAQGPATARRAAEGPSRPSTAGRARPCPRPRPRPCCRARSRPTRGRRCCTSSAHRPGRGSPTRYLSWGTGDRLATHATTSGSPGRRPPAPAGDAEEREHVVVGIAGVDPAEAVRAEVPLPQRRLGPVEPVELGHEAAHPGVVGPLVEHPPVQGTARATTPAPGPARRP